MKKLKDNHLFHILETTTSRGKQNTETLIKKKTNQQNMPYFTTSFVFAFNQLVKINY